MFVELAYYWSFTASLQAVLTPDLGVTFPNLLYFTYHAGAIVAAAGLAMLIAAATITTSCSKRRAPRDRPSNLR